MRKRKIKAFPRQMLKNLAEDLSKLVITDEGSLLALELVEEIPYEIRPEILEGLSAFYWSEMVTLFHLLKVEYGRELEPVCQHALNKYKMAGLNVDPGNSLEGDFYKAYVSCTRQTGKVSLDVAWNIGDNGLHVECFYLSFSSDGIHSFFLVENMPVKQYEQDRKGLNTMQEISYQEACFLINEAFKFNTRNMSKPAIGRFMYQKYLDDNIDLRYDEMNRLMRNISARLTPRQMVNCFFYALKCQDFNYMFSMLSENGLYQGMLFQQLNKVLSPGTFLLEGQVEEVHAQDDEAEIIACSLTMHERDMYSNEYLFKINRNEKGEWEIYEIERLESEIIDSSSDDSPLGSKVYCRLYEIIDLDGLFDVLETVENISDIEELPYGMHMRISCFDDDPNHGVSLLSGVIADLVINGDEFVILSRDQEISAQFHDLLCSEYSNLLIPRGEYVVSMVNAYSYLTGQYINFEDILLDESNELIFEDGMRFITTRYLVKDREEVTKRLEKLDGLKFDLAGDGAFRIYYQMEENNAAALLAEYILGPGWITVSAFGDKDMGKARYNFEKDMFDALEFDGVEIREDGIFEILTVDVKKQYPELEAQLKEMYLNKWYGSNLSTLRGMSPSEACQTEEGTRLLWDMFKKIKKKEKRKRMRGECRLIGLKEYIRRLEI